MRNAALRTRAAALITVGAVALVACGGGSSGEGATSRGAGDFGSLEAVCHDAEGTNVDPGERGVTDATIEVTTISDAGSSLRSGLNQEIWDASEVFVDWCNANGGINGRTIVLTRGDAQLSLYDTVIENACERSFALVGGGGVFDSTGQLTRVSCLLPDVPAFMGSPTARGSALVYQALPSSNVELTVGVFHYLAGAFPEDRDRIATVYGAVPSMKMYRSQMVAAAKKIWGVSEDAAIEDEGTGEFANDGIYDVEYQAVGEESWVPNAQELDDFGAQGLIFAGEPADLAELLKSLQTVGNTSLKWVYALPNSYGDELLAQAGDTLDSVEVVTHMFAVPVELAEADPDAHPATAQYLDLFAEYLPDGRANTTLGLHAFAAWLLFAQAADACGAELTVTCFVEQAQSIEAFDAGGLTGPAAPAAGSVPTCYVPIVATSESWTVPEAFEADDDDGAQGVFSCAVDNVIELQGFDYSAFGDPPIALADAGRTLAQLGTPPDELD